MRLELPDDFPLQPLIEALGRVASDQGCTLTADWHHATGTTFRVHRTELPGFLCAQLTQAARERARRFLSGADDNKVIPITAHHHRGTVRGGGNSGPTPPQAA